MRVIPAFASVAALAAFAGAATAQTAPTPGWAAAIDSMMLRELARTRTPGAQIVVVERGRLAYSKAYGVADVETGRPVAERTLFQTGSVPKLVTATLLAQLAADGAVDLHAPISRYVTELTGGRAGAATVHHLLTHSAGWRDAGNAFGRLDDDALAQVFRAVGDTMVMTEPGRIPSYSNPSFSMAGYVAERATGRRFAELVDSIIFRPMGMPRATWRPTMAMTYDFSQGHDAPLGEAARVQRPMPANAADAPSGFLYISAAELSRLAIALMSGGMLDGKRVLAADAVRAMTTRHIPIPGERTLGYGYGMEVDSINGRRQWQKNGDVAGFAALVTMWPDDQLAVVVTANRRTGLPERTTPLAARIVAGITPAPVATFPDQRDATAAERAELVGTYRLGNATVVVAEVNGALEVRVAQRTLVARLTRDGSRLIATAPSDGVPHPYVIVRDADGTVRFLYRDNGRSYAKRQ